MDNGVKVKTKKMNKKKNKTTFLILLGIILFSGALLIAAILYSDGIFKEKLSLVRSETVYIIIVLMSLLLMTIIILIVIVAKKRKIRIQSYIPTSAVEEGVGKETDKVGRFCKLSAIDAKDKNEVGRVRGELDLKELCDKFRRFSASKLKLYYSESDIRKFISGLGVTHIMIMQGMSGTGKTSLAFAFGEFLGNKSTIVPIQPMWKERTDLVGYYNEFTGKYNETILLEKMYEANYSNAMYITVLDEMNIARVEYYFAEFLSLLEIPNEERRYIAVVSDNREDDPKLLKEGKLKLPKNMWYIGTVNNDDSTFAISDKVYDRAMVMNLDKKTQEFACEGSEGEAISIEKWEQAIKKAKKEYGITYRGQRKIRALDRYMIESYHITFGNRIMKQIKEYVPIYVACGGEEQEAIDDIIMKKVLRKLESQNPVYVRKTIGKLIEEIEEIFGSGEMPLCVEYLNRLEKTI